MRLSHHRSPRRRPPGGSQLGAALVEMALIAMFLVTIAAGAYDFGQAWRTATVVNEAARAGARTGSSMGDQPLADWYALSNARAALDSANRLNDVQRVVIYRSDTANGAVPSSCTSGTSTSAKCNVLTGAQFRALAQGDFNSTTGCIVSTKATVTNWCPSSRVTVQLSAEHYGIWIHYRHKNLFKVLGSNRDIRRDAVMRLEPEVG